MQDQVFAPKYTDNSLLIDLYSRKPSKQYQDSQKNPKERDVKYFNSHSNVRNHTIMFSHCYQKTCQRCVDYHIKHPVADQFEEKLGLVYTSHENAFALQQWRLMVYSRRWFRKWGLLQDLPSVRRRHQKKAKEKNASRHRSYWRASFKMPGMINKKCFTKS